MRWLPGQVIPYIDQLPESVRPYWWIIPILAGLLLLLILLWIVSWLRRLFTRSPPATVGHDHGLRENLGEYPPLGGSPGARRLTIDGAPVRLRLVVVAPVGKEATISLEMVGSLLDQLVKGLGKLMQQDRARIRVWPPQLSSQGFAAVFHRLVLKPDPEGQPTHWILLAGQVRIQQQPILLGLGLWADEADFFARRTLDPEDWTRHLRFENVTP